MNDKLFYFSKSQDKPVGKGVNEYINSNIYKDLDEIKDWRKILSNFYEAPFIYKNKTYNTVEHAFQSEKIRLVDIDKAEWFTLESKHVIGLGDGLIARQSRKLVLLDKDKLKIWDEIRDKIMEEIMYQKFTQISIAKKVLLATEDAELWHATAREKPSRQIPLENVRNRLNN
jgi:ribA/ribD-fused uncharacterized protein